LAISKQKRPMNDSAAWVVAGAARAEPKVGAPAPDFTVDTFGGHRLKLADLKGDVIILNFWATWCGPCRTELPLLEAYFRHYSKYGLQVIAVATEDSVPESQLRPLASKLTIPFIDRSGKLVYAKAAAFDLDRLNAIVVPLLNEPVPDSPPATAGASSASTSAPVAP
jgi:thiol-disulfide isomerase/thioredoxin